MSGNPKDKKFDHVWTVNKNGKYRPLCGTIYTPNNATGLPQCESCLMVASGWQGCNEIKIYYMRDNHTFFRLGGTTMDEVLNNADKMANESPGGMLCSPILLWMGKEVRRINVRAHAPWKSESDARWTSEKNEWRNEFEADAVAMALLLKNTISA